jgi:hypothetical protein
VALITIGAQDRFDVAQEINAQGLRGRAPGLRGRKMNDRAVKQRCG